MRIEFMGLPGAGKTTLLERWGTVADRRWQPVAPAPTWLRRRLLQVKAGWSYREAVVIAGRRILASPRDVRDKWFAFRLVLVALAKRCEQDGGSEDALRILDEGPVQRAFTIFVDSTGLIDVPLVLRYVRRIPRPDLLIHLKVEPRVALERLRMRSRGAPDRFEGVAPTRMLQIFGRAARMLELIGEDLEAAGTVVIVVPPRASPEEALGLLEDGLERTRMRSGQ